MDDVATSYISPKLRSRNTNGSRSCFATEPIKAGEVISVWGGEVVPQESFFRLPAAIQQISVQVEENLYLAPGRESAGEWINHSCEPNCGMSGQIVLVAMRDIPVGEEVCYDYAMSDGSPYDEFECRCGSPLCRRRVTGNDWSIPSLWTRYDGYFSPYLQRRIEKLRASVTLDVGGSATSGADEYPLNGDGHAQGDPGSAALNPEARPQNRREG